jgi:RNA polymerase sigma factor (sigma-70 family)
VTVIDEPPDAGVDSASGGNANADALRFLEQLLVTHPDIDATALDSEVAALLGREPKRAIEKVQGRARLALEADDSRDDAGFDWYQQLIAGTPRLDDTHTSEAARRVEVGLLAEERLAATNLSHASRRELAELYTLAEEGREAWTWLVLTNLRLVFHWSKGVARSVDPDWAQDAFQVGCIGLMRGLQGWDYAMGYKLSTFVSWHVRQAIQRWRANDVMIIRVPVHVWDAMGGEEADLNDKTREAAERAQDLASLEAMLFDRGEDVDWDGGIQAAEERIDRERAISGLLDGLDERTRDIIERRFGMRDDLDGPMTLDDIGEVWNVTRERIRQVEKKAMEALRTKALGLPVELPTKRKRRQQVRSDVAD